MSGHYCNDNFEDIAGYAKLASQSPYVGSLL